MSKLTHSGSDVLGCHCGGDASYGACCEPFVSGRCFPATAAELMRSRFSAFKLKNSEYLESTWHETTRPATIDFSNDRTVWLRLNVLDTLDGQAGDSTGEVEFQAWYGIGLRMGCQQERSRFLNEGGRWFYVDGEMLTPMDSEFKVGRNEPCPCDSGKKHKRCCGRFLS